MHPRPDLLLLRLLLFPLADYSDIVDGGSNGESDGDEKSSGDGAAAVAAKTMTTDVLVEHLAAPKSKSSTRSLRPIAVGALCM